MKKIYLLLAAVCALTACDPVEEDFSNGGHITAEKLRDMTSVTVDQDGQGHNGNVITCTTDAPVNAKWSLGGKEFTGNYAWKKMKVGEHKVFLDALCADGTLLRDSFVINCEVITDSLQRFWIYGNPELLKDDNPDNDELPFSPAAWDAAEMRFSATEGKHFPFLTDEVYWGFKTLIFDITGATDDCAGRIMNGWWSARYDGDKDVKFTNGQWELPLTEAIAKDCAKGNGGGGKDLDLMVTSGSCTVNAVYYEE